jgi:hypothetical protein
MGEPIKRPSQEQKVITQYKEQGRHGETYTGTRLPPTERRDFLPRIKRAPGGRPR